MRRRIVTLYLVLTVIVSSLVAFVTYRYSSRMYIREIETGLAHEAVLVSRIIRENRIDDINDAFLKKLSDELAAPDKGEKDSRRRITLINREGVVLSDSSGKSKEMGNHGNRREFLDALETGSGSQIRKSETTGVHLIYYARRIEDLDIVVRISASVEHTDEIRNTILFYALMAVFVGMILSSVLVLKFSDFVVRPIARLVQEYGGSLGMNKPYGRRVDEVGQLSFTLSNMTRHIENIINELKDRNARVDTIINSMDNAIIAVDRTMHIIMINPVAINFFGTGEKTDYIGMPLIQIIRNRQINELLIKAIATNKVMSDEITLLKGGRRVFSIHVSPIHPMEGQDQNSGALAHIYDITQVRKFEEMRSEFVSNVTHELKTPLTSIQGFVETLKSGAVKDPAVAARFLDIIDIEAARLHTLIDDILELSEIENNMQDGNLESFELLPLVMEIRSMLENVAAEKNITMEIHAEPGIKLQASRNRIKQLIINLMDNAIKYNKPGGKVTVSARHTDTQLVISVKDTGIGIPPEHTGRIFERFYRVDKGRSREMGGTGLGLSIVKHIAQQYGGSVRVESRVGEGSEFIVTLPNLF